MMMEKGQERVSLLSRRNFVTKAGIFVAGGIAGYGSLALAATPTETKPPPLPWKWVKLDPLEAGRRAYRSYLKEKG
jgi:hypothetical protein